MVAGILDVRWDKTRNSVPDRSLPFVISPCHERKIYGDICVDFRGIIDSECISRAGEGAKVGDKHGNGNGRVPMRR